MHTVIDGSVLSLELKQFSAIASDNFQRRIHCFIESQPFTNEPVFVTEEEKIQHYKIENYNYRDNDKNLSNSRANGLAEQIAVS